MTEVQSNVLFPNSHGLQIYILEVFRLQRMCFSYQLNGIAEMAPCKPRIVSQQ